MILHPSLASANPLHYGRELTALDNLDFGSRIWILRTAASLTTLRLG